MRLLKQNKGAIDMVLAIVLVVVAVSAMVYYIQTKKSASNENGTKTAQSESLDPEVDAAGSAADSTLNDLDKSLNTDASDSNLNPKEGKLQ
jgi:hypothetical protein